jgi:hypothetical protein
MASIAKSKVFRVTGLPVGKAEPYVQSTLVQTIRDILSNDEQQRLEVRVACVAQVTQVENSALSFFHFLRF